MKPNTTGNYINHKTKHHSKYCKSSNHTLIKILQIIRLIKTLWIMKANNLLLKIMHTMKRNTSQTDVQKLNLVHFCPGEFVPINSQPLVPRTSTTSAWHLLDHLASGQSQFWSPVTLCHGLSHVNLLKRQTCPLLKCSNGANGKQSHHKSAALLEP